MLFILSQRRLYASGCYIFGKLTFSNGGLVSEASHKMVACFRRGLLFSNWKIFLMLFFQNKSPPPQIEISPAGGIVQLLLHFPCKRQIAGRKESTAYSFLVQSKGVWICTWRRQRGGGMERVLVLSFPSQTLCICFLLLYMKEKGERSCYSNFKVENEKVIKATIKELLIAWRVSGHPEGPSAHPSFT